jgi:ABC-type branched-subunit amino acid transport system ATPase component
VSFILRPGEILGVVGANGAGKTTLVDAVSGYAPCTGLIKLGDDDIGALAPHVRARRGITRSFQSLELFEDLTVAENLAVASERIRPPEWVTAALHASPVKLDGEAALVAEQFALEEHLGRKPTELSYALRRLLGIARAVATSPSVLLLDEPASGLGEADRGNLCSLLRSMVERFGMSVLLIEHDVELVMDVSDRILAMGYGEVIAIGAPEEIRRDPRVIAAYLGTDPEETGLYESKQVSRAIDG